MWWLGPSNVTKDQKLTGFLTQVSRLLPRWMKQWEMQKKHWQNVSSLHILTTNNIISQNAPSYMLDSVLNTPMQSQPKLIENEEITRKQQQMESQPSRTKSQPSRTKKNCYQQECKLYQRKTNGWMACDWQKVKVLYELGLLGNFCYSSFVSSRIKLLRCPIKIRSKVYNSIDVVHLKCFLQNGILFVWSLLLKLLYTWPRSSFCLFKFFHLLR